MKAVLASGAVLLALLIAACGDSAEIPSGPALVHVSGTIVSVSANDIVVRDGDGNHVKITLEEAEGPSARFCRQVTTPNYCAVLSEAAPQAGEDVCLLAHLTSEGKLVGWKVLLESTCQQVPSTG